MTRTKKRTSLDAVLGEMVEGPASLPAPVPEPRTPAAAKPSDRQSGKRPRVKQQTAYLPLPVYEQLRHLAFEERTKMHDYLMEGLDRVFQDRGLPSIAELAEKQKR